MSKLICPRCQSEIITTIVDKNSTYLICSTCGYRFSPKRVFISYGRDEYAHFAENLKEQLIRLNCNVWFDRDRIMEGGDWEQYIEDGLNWVAEAGEDGVMLFVVTPHSVRRPDGYCLKEMAKAISKRIKIVPVMLIFTELPLSICNLQWFDMQDCLPLEDRFANFQKKSEHLFEILGTKQIQSESMQFTLSSILEPIDYCDDIIAKTKKFTGRKWLIKIFDNWLKNSTGKNRIFWLTGAPGVGKSSIAAWIAENRREVGAIHFCGFKNEEKNNPVRLIKSITYQLTTQLPGYSEVLMELRVNDILKTYNDTITLFNKLVVSPLSKIPAPGRTIVIVIDALDEASKNGRNEVATFIANEFDKTPVWLKLFITSRPDPEVMVPLQKLSPFTIDTECADNQEDIKNFLKIELLTFLSEVQLGRIDDFVNKIAAKSEGVFQYVRCICDELAREELLIDNIDNFPKSLGSIYLNFFERQFKDIDYYQKNAKDIIGVIISAKEPILTKLLKKIFNVDDTIFYNLIVLMGSIFDTKGEGDSEVIKVQHLSYTDWLTNREKSGYYYVGFNDGIKRLVEYGLSEYSTFLKEESYNPDIHFFKWLPAYLADLNDYQKLSVVLNNKKFTRKRIELGFKDILFKDFQRQLNLSNNGSYKGDYYKILANSIHAHNLTVSIFVEKIKELTKEGKYDSLKQAIEATNQLRDKELLISYFAILHSALFLDKLEYAEKKEIVLSVLGQIEKEFIIKPNHINCLDFLPLYFVNAICYEIEDIGINCSNIIGICRYSGYVGRDVYNDAIQWLNGRIHLNYEEYLKDLAYDLKDYIQSFMLTDLAFSFYFNNKTEKATEIIKQCGNNFITYFQNNISEFKTNKDIIKDTDNTDLNSRQHFPRYLLIIYIILFLILTVLMFVLYSFHFLAFLLFKIAHAIFKHSSIISKRIEGFWYRHRRCIERTADKILGIIPERAIEIVDDFIDKVFPKKEPVNIYNSMIPFVNNKSKLNGNQKKQASIALYECLFNKSLTNHHLIKILSLGDIAFISKNPRGILDLQKEIVLNIDSKCWVSNVTGRPLRGRLSHDCIDWSSVRQEHQYGLFNEKELEHSYNNMRFFVDNFEFIDVYSVWQHFPETMFGESNILLNKKDGLKQKIKEDTENKIKFAEKNFFFHTFINEFNSTTLRAGTYYQTSWHWDTIGVLHYHDYDTLNNQHDKAGVLLKTAHNYVEENSKEGECLFIDLFNLLYVHKNIDATCKLLLEQTKNSDLSTDILLVNYLAKHNLSLLEIILPGLAENTIEWKFIITICWLTENGLIENVINIANMLSNTALKDKLSGHIAYHFIKKDKHGLAIKYLTDIEDETEKSKWMQIASLLFAGKNEIELTEKCIEQISFINQKAITLCQCAEILYEKDSEIARRLLLESYNDCLHVKQDIDTKKTVLERVFLEQIAQDSISMKAFEMLVKEELMDEKEKSDYLLIAIKFCAEIDDLRKIENLRNSYPDFFHKANGISSLYKHGYTFDDNNNIRPVKRHYEIFRNLKTIENGLHEFTAENLFNKDNLLDIAYRYAAYITFISNDDLSHRKIVLQELSEIIEINDWLARLKKWRFLKKREES